jgi:FtsP/CotA-like multicopper oxidase with cupredoxin domain
VSRIRRPFRLVAVGLIVAALLLPLFSLGTRLRSAPAAEPPQTREFTLTAEEIDWEIQPGTTVRAWAYNGQVPGPEIRVREGDLVRIKLINHLRVPTTIHWLGLDVTPAMDGVAGLNQEPVVPEGEFTYEFIATPAGSRMYHSHTDIAKQLALGLYGPFIVEPREPVRSYEYDREYTVMLNEWDLELTPEVAAGKAPLGPRDQTLRGGELGTDLFLMNGHSHDAIEPIRLAEGERVLIRLMNLGHLAHPIHTHGHSFKIVATDGNPVPEGMELVKDTVLIGPGERYDIELMGTNAGVWMFHCHIESHAANGMMGLIVYDGQTPTGPAAAFFDRTGQMTDDNDMGHEHTAASPEAAAPTAEAAPTATPPVVANVATDGPVVEVGMVDDRFDPREITVAAGTTVRWVNRGADWHSIAAYDGSFESVKLAPGEAIEVRFDTPGVYQYICKHHGLQGMIGTVIVT